MRLSRSGSNDSRDAAAIARMPRMSEAMAICLLWRRQRDARASRALFKASRDNTRGEMSQEMQKAEGRRQKRLWRVVLFCLLPSAFCILLACQRREPLTAQKAAEIIRGYQFAKEPIY